MVLKLAKSLLLLLLLRTTVEQDSHQKLLSIPLDELEYVFMAGGLSKEKIADILNALRQGNPSCCSLRLRTTPFPEGKSILGVIYGVLLSADMNAATPLGVLCNFSCRCQGKRYGPPHVPRLPRIHPHVH